MALSDYLNGPTYRRQVQDLESQLAQLQDRYAQMQALVKKYGAMEVLEIQRHIEQENATLGEVRLAIQTAQRDVAALAHQTSELRGQILVFDETLLLESFALYQPKFKRTGAPEGDDQERRRRHREHGLGGQWEQGGRP
jgi:DNA repair exonuclease SbcCD ATPase subunit